MKLEVFLFQNCNVKSEVRKCFDLSSMLKCEACRDFFIFLCCKSNTRKVAAILNEISSVELKRSHKGNRQLGSCETCE